MRPSFSPQDPDFEARVRASFGAQAMMATMGVEIRELGPGWIDIEFPHRPEFTQQHGFVHAGAVATAMDSACGYAGFSLMPPDAAVLTAEYKINLLRPAKADRYLVSGEVVKPGRTLTVCRATALNSDTGDEIAVMTATLVTLIGTDIRN